MECRNCPYIQDEFDNRMNRYNNRVQEDGIPNSVYGYLNYDEASDEVEQYCWCEKTGGKVWWYGQCSDAHVSEQRKKYTSKRKKRNKRERDLKYKNHLKHLYDINTGYPPPVIYTDEIFIRRYEWIENPKPYYKRLYRSNGKRSSSNYHKKMSNRRIRRYKGHIPNGYWCHKLYDYWWEMY